MKFTGGFVDTSILSKDLSRLHVCLRCYYTRYTLNCQSRTELGWKKLSKEVYSLQITACKRLGLIRRVTNVRLLGSKRGDFFVGPKYLVF